MNLAFIPLGVGLILLGVGFFKSWNNSDDSSTLTTTSSAMKKVKSQPTINANAAGKLEKDVTSAKIITMEPILHEVLNYRRNFYVNLRFFKDKTIKSLKSICSKMREKNPISETNFYIDRRLDCPRPDIRIVIETFIQELVLCYSEDNRPSPTELNKAIEEAEIRYCILDRMMKLQWKKKCYSESHYRDCVRHSELYHFWSRNIMKFILSVTDGGTIPFNKETEDNNECKNANLLRNCFIEAAEECDPEIKLEASRLASEYWYATSCVEV